MKKLLALVSIFVLSTNTAQAFVVEEHCNDFATFSISSEEACAGICPNREAVYTGGTSFMSYACYLKDRVAKGESLEDVSWDERLSPLMEQTCCEDGEIEEIKKCVGQFAERGEEYICLHPDIPEEKLKYLCPQEKEYELDTSYALMDTNLCVKKCPTDKPLRGMEGECYSCEIPYKIMLSGARDYVNKDSDFVNVCPNRVIVHGISYKNPIDSCDTIEKVKKVISDGEYNTTKDISSKFYDFSLLEWNTISNHNPEVIKYLLDNDPKAKRTLTFALMHSIDKKVPESVVQILLDKATSDNLVISLRHGVLYGVFIEDTSPQKKLWDVPLSFYAKYAGASESIQNLIKSYEKKFGIDYAPKILVDTDDEQEEK